jgi:hypothetical protein
MSKRGIPRSPECKAKMSASTKGRVETPEWRAKISAAMKGRPKRMEHQEKINAANRAAWDIPAVKEARLANRRRDRRSGRWLPLI